MKVFLGGTCNDSRWRDELIPLLDCEFYNPVVKDWTPECQAREIHERNTCDFVLYVITPEMTGVYSIAEVIDDSNKRPDKTLFAYIGVFERKLLKSLEAVRDMVYRNGGLYFNNLQEIADYLNMTEKTFEEENPYVWCITGCMHDTPKLVRKRLNSTYSVDIIYYDESEALADFESGNLRNE